MIEYNVYDWYWQKEDGRVYSSARDGLFPENDGLFQAWLDSGGLVTRYPKDSAGNESWYELMKVLENATQPVGRYNQIHAEIEEHERKAARALQDITAAGLEGKKPDPNDESWLKKRRAAVAELRDELKALEAANG